MAVQKYNRWNIVLPFVSMLLMGGCNPDFWRSVAESETFNFRYVLIQEDPLGDYLVNIKFTNRNCEPVRLSDSELHDLFTTKSHSHAGVTYEFDFDMLTACNDKRLLINDQHIKNIRHTVGDDASVTRFGGGRSQNGLSIEVGQIKIIVYSMIGGALSPGPMTLLGGTGVTDIPALSVDSSGEFFSPLNLPVSTRFFEFNLLDILSNPNRITADFRFIASQPGSTERLLVWDGEIVLQGSI